VDVDPEAVAQAVREVLPVTGLLDDARAPRRRPRSTARPAPAASIAADCASSTIDQIVRYSSVGLPNHVERVMS
jgi:hypothetical protein